MCRASARRSSADGGPSPTPAPITRTTAPSTVTADRNSIAFRSAGVAMEERGVGSGE